MSTTQIIGILKRANKENRGREIINKVGHEIGLQSEGYEFLDRKSLPSSAYHKTLRHTSLWNFITLETKKKLFKLGKTKQNKYKKFGIIMALTSQKQQQILNERCLQILKKNCFLESLTKLLMKYKDRI